MNLSLHILSDIQMSDITPLQNGLTDEDIFAILTGIKNNPKSVVVSSTGSGKTTKLVKAIYQKGKCQIFIVEPTIPAAENPYNYMGDDLGKDIVGMAAEGNVKYKVDTPIVYCTSGHIRRKLIGLLKSGATDLRFCDVLMVDEAHSGTLDNDVIMSIWNYAFEKGYAVPKLLLASATLAIEQTPFAGQKDVFVYDIITKSYPVAIHYSTMSYSPESRNLLRDTAALILDTHHNTPLPEDMPQEPTPIGRLLPAPDTTGDVLEGDELITHKPIVTRKGDKWLVFCSGQGEVNDMIKHLNAGLSDDDKLVVDVVAIYGQISTEERRKVFQPAPAGKRIIVVGTNVAETSVTIDGLSVIFDTMTEKFGETSKSGGFRLVQNRISKSSAKQRAGRVGRQFPGTVYRMITEQDFAYLPEQRITELNRVPLHTMSIELLDAGINPIDLFHKRIDPKQLLLSVGLLKRLGMITETGQVTQAGEFAASFPLGVRSSGVIWEWIKAGKPLFPCVVTMALIDCFNPSYFYYPRIEEPDEAKRQAITDKHYAKYFAKFSAPTDIGVLLNIWSSVSKFVGKLDTTNKKFTRWCSENSMNQRKVRELFNIIRQVCNSLYRLGREVKVGPFNHDNVINVLTPILAKVYADLTFDYVGSEKYFDPYNRDYYRLDKRHSLIGVPRPNVEKVITLISIETQNRKISLPVRTITLFHPIGNTVDKNFVRDGPALITPATQSSKAVAAFGTKVNIVIPTLDGNRRPGSPQRLPTAPIVITMTGLNKVLPTPMNRLTLPGGKAPTIPGLIPMPTNAGPQRPIIVPEGTPLPIATPNIVLRPGVLREPKGPVIGDKPGGIHSQIKPKAIVGKNVTTVIATTAPKGIVLQIPQPSKTPMSPRLIVKPVLKPGSPTARPVGIPFVAKELSPRSTIHSVYTPGSPRSVINNAPTHASPLSPTQVDPNTIPRSPTGVPTTPVFPMMPGIQLPSPVKILTHTNTI
jgi:HrpA-like RNA helicase